MVRLFQPHRLQVCSSSYYSGWCKDYFRVISLLWEKRGHRILMQLQGLRRAEDWALNTWLLRLIAKQQERFLDQGVEVVCVTPCWFAAPVR